MCERVRPTLPGDWSVEIQQPLVNPVADSCWLTSTTDPKNRYRIAVGVLPLTKQDIADFRKSSERRLKEDRYAARAVDAGIGENSWSVNPAAEGPWLVFFSGGRMVRVAQEAYGPGQLAAITAVARTINTLPGGVPAGPKIVGRPECEPATAAAEKVLSGKALARRDALVDGEVMCLWASARAGVVVAGGGPASEAATDFGLLKSTSTNPVPEARRVDVGQEGWQHDSGYLVYRIGEDRFVTITPSSLTAEQSAAVVALGQATIPIYNR
ncbi:hypothetical protein [Kribbella sp. DT2]|uniref:hypothetical protein n=1 Tax=Kribbella sp. DT2 TaxID=3393427 RepID=UPI003CF6F9BD